MTVYPDLIRIAVGSSAMSSYQPFPIAPYFEGLEYPAEIYTGTGVFDDGLPLARLIFNRPTADVWVRILTLAGVLSAKTATVTLALPDATRLASANWNGQAVSPALVGRRWDLLRYGQNELLVRNLKAVP